MKSRIYLLLASFLIIASPILWSQYLIKQSLLNSDTLQITLVQPNVDTYSEKFNSMSPLQQSEHIIEMLRGAPFNSLIVLPETAIPKYFNLNQEKPASIDTLLSFSRLKRLRIIGGFSTKDTSNSYNSACLIEDGIIVDSRNKIKLLAYAEKIPFDFISEYWSRMVHEQGGIAKSYGVDQEAKVFSINRDVKLGTLICFESVFSDISAEMCRKGAQALIVITNDDWWENSPGHRQHFAYARIKAIENRKYIARAANTGISGVIDPYGKIVRSSRYKESVVMQSKINLNSRLTFFSVNERNIRYSIVFLAVFLALASWWKRLH